MNVSHVTDGLMSSSVQGAARGAKQASYDALASGTSKAGVERAGDTVELSSAASASTDDAVAASDGKATGHARVAQNIERRVEKLIARETARAGVGEAAGSVAGFEEAVRELAAAYSADSSAPPSGVLGDIRAAVERLRSGGFAPEPATPEPVEPATPVDGSAGPVVDGGTPVVDMVPTDATPVATEPIAVDLSGLRLTNVYSPVTPVASAFQFFA